MRLLLVLLLAVPVFAQQEVAVSYGRTDFDTQGDAPAIGLSYARFWTPALGARLAGFRAAETLNADGGELQFYALYAMAEFQPFRDRVVSPRVAAGVAFASNRVEPPFGGTISDESRITVAAGGGVDLRVTPRFAVGAELLYMSFPADSDDRFAAALDPLTVSVAARVRW
jgi:hypothetical protein